MKTKKPSGSSTDELIEKFRRIKSEMKELEARIESLKSKKAQILRWTPRLREIYAGKPCRDADRIEIRIGDEVVEEVWDLPSERMTDTERKADSEVTCLRDQQLEAQKKLRELEEELNTVGFECTTAGIAEPILNSGTMVDEPPDRRPGRPRDTEVERRRKLILEFTKAATLDLLNKCLRDTSARRKLFQRLDEEGIPLINSKNFRQYSRWTDIEGGDDLNAKDSIIRDMRRHFDRLVKTI